MMRVRDLTGEVGFAAWAGVIVGIMFLAAQQWFAAVVVLVWGGAHETTKRLVHRA